MRLISLRLKNFRQHADTSLAFATGLTGIVGPNGEGKSTILEAVAWVLFGSRALRGAKSGVRWNRAPARHLAEGELVFEVAGAAYRLRRTESGAELFLAGGGRAIAEGTSAMDAEIPRLLGMSYPEFTATYMCAQKDLGALVSMRGTERRQFFLRVMGVGRIDLSLKAVRETRSALRSERDGLRVGLGDRDVLLADQAADGAEQEAAAAALEGASYEAARAEEQLGYEVGLDAAAAGLAERDAELRRELAAAGTLLLEAAEEHERAGATLLQAHAAEERVVAAGARLQELPAMRERAVAIREARAREGERVALQARRDAAEGERSLAIQRLADAERQVAGFDPEALESARTTEAALADQLDRLTGARRDARATATAEVARAETAATRIRKRLSAIAAAGADGKCPTCSRALGEAFDAVVADLTEDLQAELRAAEAATRAFLAAREPSDQEMGIAAELDAVRVRVVRLEQLQADAAQGRQAAELLRRDETRLLDEIAQLVLRLAALPAPAPAEGADQVAAAIAELEQLDRAIAADRSLAGRIPSLEEDLGRWAARRATLLADGERLRAEIAALAYDPAAREVAAASLAVAREDHRRAGEEQARARAALSAATDRVQRADAAVAAYDGRAGRLRAVEEDLRLHEASDQWFQRFRVSQAEAIRPELEELTSAMVAQLTDGRFEAVELDADFQPVPFRGGVGMEVISGGEEDVVALAMRLATSQMIAERAGHPLSLLILDEPFGSQDEVRRANMLSLIRRLGGVFEQVLVISHVEDTREAVDRAIAVRFDEASGRSYVEDMSAPRARLEAA